MANAECRKTVEAQQKAIETQQELLTENEKRIRELEKKETSKSFWFILGSIFTGIVIFLVK